MYLCPRNYDLSRGGTFETAKAGTFHSVTAGTLIPLSAPFAKICINGNELTFLLDTGAGLSVYDKKYLQYLGLTEDQLGAAVTNISGVGENSFGGRLVMIFFNIDDMRFVNKFTVSELGETFRAFKDSLGDVAGIIGGDFLFNYGAIIDYGAQEIRVEEERIDSVMKEVFGG